MNHTMPILRLELEGIKECVAHAFSANQDELKKMVEDTLESELSEEWVRREVATQVRHCIEKAITSVSDDWNLQNAIRSTICKKIQDSLEIKKV